MNVGLSNQELVLAYLIIFRPFQSAQSRPLSRAFRFDSEKKGALRVILGPVKRILGSYSLVDQLDIIAVTWHSTFDV